MYNNGHPRHYTTLHNADLVGVKTVAYIKRFSRSDAPFFIWASQVAPHGACLPSAELSCEAAPIPAARHAALFSATRSPSLKDPAFNEADMSDKPSAMRQLPLRTVSSVNRSFRARIRALQAVDEADAATIRALRDAGELDNTIVAMTSDNGFLLGEHRKMSKNAPYEQALRVPLLVRGPGIPAGETRDQTVATIDLAPTLLDVARTRATLRVDGRSLVPFLANSTVPGPDTVLIQAGPVTADDRRFGWSWRGVRSARYTYVDHLGTAELELYDRQLDPAELDSVAGRPEYAPVQAEMERRLQALGACAGASCRQSFGADPEPLPTP
jgi:arylsulfatase A-like enzyme